MPSTESLSPFLDKLKLFGGLLLIPRLNLSVLSVRSDRAQLKITILAVVLGKCHSEDISNFFLHLVVHESV